MQTFINFHPKLSASHVRLDRYRLFTELAHVLRLAHSDCCTDPKGWIGNAPAAELMLSLKKNGLVSRKPGLRDELSPVSYSFTDFLHHPKNLGAPSFPIANIALSSTSRVL